MASKLTTDQKVAELDKIKQEILDNEVCSQLAETAHGLVFGEGDVNADIVFIGEAPGKQEDEQGRPFVGASGKFLNSMLETIGLSRDQVYITNIVKYRPPNNRDPLPQEKEDFFKYLNRQLDIIDPKLIVTLGRHSTNVFLPGLYISEVHGQPQKVGERTYLPLYHPAAALYNGGMRQTLIDDFSKIPEILNLIDN